MPTLEYTTGSLPVDYGQGEKTPPVGKQETLPVDYVYSDLIRSDLILPDQISGPSKLNNSNSNTMSAPQGAIAVVKPPSPFQFAMCAFCETWREHYGTPYVPTPVDCNQLRLMMRRLDEEAVQALPAAFTRYLEDMSPFVAQEMRHSLRFFCTSGGINKYRTEVLVMSKREASTLAAGRQWLAMTSGGGGGNGRK